MNGKHKQSGTPAPVRSELEHGAKESPLSSFGPNKGMLALVSLLMIVFAVLGITNSEGFGIMFVFFGAWFSWLLSVRIAFYKDGLVYKSIFGQKEILWQDVQEINCRALKERGLYFGIDQLQLWSFTYYRFEVRTFGGKRIVLGNRFERPAEVGDRLVEFSRVSGRNIVSWN